MATYRRVYDSRNLQADCPEPGSAPEPYSPQSSVGYLYLFSPDIATARASSMADSLATTMLHFGTAHVEFG